MDAGDKTHSEEELGDVFFVLAQLARHLKLEAETVARAGNRKFEIVLKNAIPRNFQKPGFSSIPPEEKERMWEEIKKSKA